jgi:RNA pseudouridylate synthase
MAAPGCLVETYTSDSSAATDAQPSVYHLCLKKSGSADGTPAHLVAQQMIAGLSEEAFAELVAMGAVYSGRATLGAKGRPAAVTAAAGPTRTSFAVGKAVRLTDPNTLLIRGSYLRVHVRPLRYPVAASTDWSSRVVADTPDYICIDKPAGVPSVSTIDNALDSALQRTQAMLLESGGAASSDAQPLRAVSRLDVCTSGLLVFAKTAAAAAELGAEISSRRMIKRYRVLLSTDGGAMPPVGTMLHCCRTPAAVGDAQPRVYAAYDERLLQGDKPEWCRAELKVLGTDAASREGVIELITGR